MIHRLPAAALAAWLLALPAGPGAAAAPASTPAAAAPASAPASAADDAAAFTDYVAGRLRQELGDAVTVKGPLTLQVGGSTQANLDRVFAFCRRNPDGCDDEVATYVKGAAEAERTASAPATREAVRLVVRPESYLHEARRTVPSGKLASWPLVKGLVVLPVVDSPRTVRLLHDKDAQALKLSPDELYRVGVDNLEASMAPLMATALPAGPGEIRELAGDYFQSSRLVLHDDWAPLAKAQGGRLVVAAPARDALYYIGDESPQAVDALRTLSRKVRERSPAPLSDALLRWTPSGWEPLP